MNSHGTQRMAQTGCNCPPCQVGREGRAAQLRAYYDANREKVLEQKRGYYEANREKIAERDRAYRKANPEKIAEYQCAYRKANREELAEYKRAYRKANPIAIRIRSQRSTAMSKRRNGFTATRTTGRRPWTPAEELLIFQEGISSMEIALALDRTMRAVQHRRYKLRKQAHALEE